MATNLGRRASYSFFSSRSCVCAVACSCSGLLWNIMDDGCTVRYDMSVIGVIMFFITAVYYVDMLSPNEAVR